MEIGFISFNQDALNRAKKVMRLLQGHGAVDELGLGVIRNLFSNALFPGMSTQQSRAKYFLLMPALYAFLEKTVIQDAGEARAKIREYEISLTKRLMAGTPKEKSGRIIGAESLEKRDSFVKVEPAYMYQSGLETFGLVRSGGNINCMIAERSKSYRSLPKRQQANEDTAGDANDLSGKVQFFLTCGENYDFNGTSPISVCLSYKEASLLKRQIILKTPDSLSSFLLDSGLYTTAIDFDFESLEYVLKDKVPDKMFHTYLLARRYSRFAYLLRIRYAMLYDLEVGAIEAREEEKKFFEFLYTHRDEFTNDAIDEILSFASRGMAEDSCKIFCRRAARLINEENWPALDELIVKREIEAKSMKRSKIRNAKDYEPGKPFDSPGLMSFRWNTVVRNIFREIKEGLGE